MYNFESGSATLPAPCPGALRPADPCPVGHRFLTYHRSHSLADLRTTNCEGGILYCATLEFARFHQQWLQLSSKNQALQEEFASFPDVPFYAYLLKHKQDGAPRKVQAPTFMRSDHLNNHNTNTKYHQRLREEEANSGSAAGGEPDSLPPLHFNLRRQLYWDSAYPLERRGHWSGICSSLYSPGPARKDFFFYQETFIQMGLYIPAADVRRQTCSGRTKTLHDS